VRIPLFCAGLVAVLAVPLASIPAAPQSATPQTQNPAAKIQNAPSGPIPRTADGKPDLSSPWDHPFVIDMSKDGRNDACGAEVKGCSQKGPGGELPMTPEAAEWTKNYDPARYDAPNRALPLHREQQGSGRASY